VYNKIQYSIHTLAYLGDQTTDLLAYILQQAISYPGRTEQWPTVVQSLTYRLPIGAPAAI